VIPVTKPGKDNSEEVSKFRPINLLNVGGKVLEKVLINRINHHANSHDFLNTHQYGFTPQKGTNNAAMEIKNYVMEGLADGEVIALILYYIILYYIILYYIILYYASLYYIILYYIILYYIILYYIILYYIILYT